MDRDPGGGQGGGEAGGPGEPSKRSRPGLPDGNPPQVWVSARAGCVQHLGPPDPDHQLQAGLERNMAPHGEGGEQDAAAGDHNYHARKVKRGISAKNTPCRSWLG